MIEFYITLFALIFAILFFALFPIFKRAIVKNNFSRLTSFKVNNFAKKNKFIFTKNLNLLNTVKVDQLLVGSKYVYLIKEHCYFGMLSGKIDDNSWVHLNYIQKHANYVPNLYQEAEQRISDFSKITKLGKDVLIDIELVNSECDLRLERFQNVATFVSTPANLLKTIKKIEKREIASLDEIQMVEEVEDIKRLSQSRREINE